MMSDRELSHLYSRVQQLSFLRPNSGNVTEEERPLYRDIIDDWSHRENPKMFLGYYAAAVPEGISRGLDYLGENFPVWEEMTDYHLDKVSHFGFSYFGAKALMKGSETFPEYMKRMEESDAPLSDKIYSAGVRLSEPSIQQKAALAFTGVATLGMAKEATDSYISMLDMTANMTGASLATLEEYGEGSARQGAEKTFDDIKTLMENDKDGRASGKQLKANGGPKLVAEELDDEVEQNLEALGKL